MSLLPPPRPIDQLAFVASVISSPFITITLLGLILIPRYAELSRNKEVLMGSFFLLVVFSPFVYILTRVAKKSLTDLHVSAREQRQLPIWFAILGSFACAIIFTVNNAPKELNAIILTMTFNGVLFLATTEFAKASFHVGAFVGGVYILGLLINPYYYLGLIATPIIAWARIHRRRHTWKQIVLGIFLSLFSTFFIFKVSGLL